MKWPAHKHKIICGDCRDVLKEIPDQSVQTVVTSPPYWALRDYGIKASVWDGDETCKHTWGEFIQKGGQSNWATFENYTTYGRPGVGKGKRYAGVQTNQGQFCQDCGAWFGTLGLEPSPQMYIRHLVQIFRQVKRVLRKDGTCWINIGDSYASGGRGGGAEGSKQATNKGALLGRKKAPPGLKPKDLCLIPERLAIALQDDGWWIRQIIIWEKAAPMPEPARDRCTRSHEYVFLLTKNAKYHFDHEAIKEDSTNPESFTCRRKHNPDAFDSESFSDIRRGFSKLNGQVYPRRNRRSVWHINPKTFPGAHFATFPPELPSICILASTSLRACEECGKPWERIVQKRTTFAGGWGNAGKTAEEVNTRGKWKGKQYGRNIKLGPVVSSRTIGWRPACECYDELYRSQFPQAHRARKRLQRQLSGNWWRRVRKRPGKDTWPTVRCLVLDPFCGSGTTCAVAKQLGRDYVGIDTNADYCRMAEKRLLTAYHQLEMFDDLA